MIKVECIDDIVKRRLQMLLKLHDMVMLLTVCTTLLFIEDKKQLLIPGGVSHRDDIRFMRLYKRLVADMSRCIFRIDHCLEALVEFRNQSLHPILVIDDVGIE